MIPGIAQATDESIATNARPSSPVLAITRSIRKRRPRNVADAFQKREQAEQQHDLRDELQHGADTADDALTEQSTDYGIADVLGDLNTQPGQCAADGRPAVGPRR